MSAQWGYVCSGCNAGIKGPCTRTLKARIRRHNMTHPSKERLHLTACNWNFTCQCKTVLEAADKGTLDRLVVEHLKVCGSASKGRKTRAREPAPEGPKG